MKPTKTTDNARNGLPDLRRVQTGLHITRTRARVAQRVAHGPRQRSIEDCIQRLKLMVPNIRTDEKLDEFEILQRVIEYIQLLEEALGISVTPLVPSVQGSKKISLN
ncbi:DNA-binding inhibitor ID-4-like [Paramuricea clavata]|uniref:DNA-binding inhibitor ID-4-like n=1 Tax=Paramuricea clavata TaxID=317549 RepID=A0A6S7H061_PARCT|nr:DNA-binding inhibitor ID-4-like [Paramuricea clavata]